MVSFEHLRRSKTDDRYTCPKTNVTFPHIYKVQVPDGVLVNNVPVFVGIIYKYLRMFCAKAENCFVSVTFSYFFQ